MVRIVVVIFGLMLLRPWLSDGADTRAEAWKKQGVFPVQTVSYEWKDVKREREVPVRIYYPEKGPGPFPVIVFSHGLGGSRENYEFVGRHWASHGYVCIHVQHAGSDDGVWRNSDQPMLAMRGAAANLQNARNRPLDVTFVIDEAQKLNKGEGPLKNRLKLDAVGVAGHSFGAYTTLAVAGQGAGQGGISLKDDRVKAGIAMSAPVIRKVARNYAGIKIPILHMTGTADNSPIGDTAAEARRFPFDAITGAEQYLITFTGGDHMVFSGHRRLLSDGAKDPLFHELIKMSSTAFWDAWLKDDAEAKRWLAGNEFEKILGEAGRYERKAGR